METVIVSAELVVPTLTLPNARDVGEALTLGAVATTPVPLTETGLPVTATEADIEIEPEDDPAAVGLNVTVTVQLAPAASVALHVVVREYCGGAAPIVRLVALAVPVLEMVNDWDALDDPTVTLPKASDVGDAETLAVPPPVGHAVLPARYQMYSARSSRSLAVRPKPS